MKGAIRKNLLTERIDIVKPLGWYRDSPTLTDVDVKYLLLYFEENYGLTVEKKIIDAVAVIANENRYHPVCDFLNALQWDGTERIRFCLHRFLGSDTDDYTYEALKLFLLGAISRAFQPGCKFEVMLCLVGGQGAGKSSFFRLLAVNDDWFSDVEYINHISRPRIQLAEQTVTNNVLNITVEMEPQEIQLLHIFRHYDENGEEEFI